MKTLPRRLALTLLALILAVPLARAGETLDSVRLRDNLACGVSMGLFGFSMPDPRGTWKGIDADLCRAVASAVLGHADKVTFVPLKSEERFHALNTGEIDVLIRTTTCTFTRDTSLGLNCVGTNFYDGQGFLVRKAQETKTLADLAESRICVQMGSTSEQNLHDHFASLGIPYTPLLLQTEEQMGMAFETGKCQAITTDQSGLFSLRQGFERPDEAVILPDIISKEPLGPMVRADDDQWYKIVKWTLFALINAEELGVNSRNAAHMKRSENPELQYLLGVKGESGKMLGLSNDWAFQVLRQVGNYGEIFERNVGMESPLKLKRGLNALWTEGGILYAPPVR